MYTVYMGGYETWGGTKILSDPAEGRIVKNGEKEVGAGSGREKKWSREARLG